jgi:hypothetical protein
MRPQHTDSRATVPGNLQGAKRCDGQTYASSCTAGSRGKHRCILLAARLLELVHGQLELAPVAEQDRHVPR